jgi:hypothetical protein
VRTKKKAVQTRPERQPFAPVPSDQSTGSATMTTSTTSATRKSPARKATAAKSLATKAAAETAAVAAPRQRASAKRAAPTGLRPEERHHLIQVAAYHLAERRGFADGNHHDDWIAAEREVDAMIAAGKFTA